MLDCLDIRLQVKRPDHDKLFEVVVQINDQVYGWGSGHSKQVAARAAAQAALERIEGNRESKNVKSTT